MLKLLSKLHKDRKNVCIYFSSDDTTKFIYGQILAVNENYIAIYMISPDGCSDGILLKKTDTIIRVELEGQYSKKMEMLTLIDPSEVLNYSFEENIVKSMMLIAQASRNIISIELIDSGYDDIVGFVCNIDNDMLKIEQIDEYGYDDGYSYINISDITQISYNSQDEKRIFKLWQLRQ